MTYAQRLFRRAWTMDRKTWWNAESKGENQSPLMQAVQRIIIAEGWNVEFF